MQDLDFATGKISFQDRREAGVLLGAALKERGPRATLVLGLTRGGVPVAAEVAKALAVPMDILVVKKLRAPISGELAIGAICADGTRLLRDNLIREIGVSPQYLDLEISERLGEATAADERYRQGEPALGIGGQGVLIVDDGIATGATMEAAVLSARNRGATTVAAAVPVGSVASCTELRSRADDVFCLVTPVEFWAVGQYYVNFSQVTDDEVRQVLAESRSMLAASGKNRSLGAANHHALNRLKTGRPAAKK